MLSGPTLSADEMAGTAVFRIVVSSDSIKKATATSHGKSCLLATEGWKNRDELVSDLGEFIGCADGEKRSAQYHHGNTFACIAQKPDYTVMLAQDSRLATDLREWAEQRQDDPGGSAGRLTMCGHICLLRTYCKVLRTEAARDSEGVRSEIP